MNGVGEIHRLKTWPEYFARVWSGAKRAELRKDDRGFAVGDTIQLEEYEPPNGDFLGVTYLGRYTGRVIVATVTDVIRDAERFGLMAGYAVLSFEVASWHDSVSGEASHA